MTGSELRALLSDWNISRRIFVDSLAAIGYRTEVEYVGRWDKRVPETAARLIEAWRADPSQRPVLFKRPAVIPGRRSA